MFEITPKEQLLKNVRKGLVQPLPNKYPLLNFDKMVLKEALLKHDEGFIKPWTEQGYYFAVYNGNYDLLLQLRSICKNYDLGVPAVDDPQLKVLLNENEMVYTGIELVQKTICCGFSKLEAASNTVYFSSELHPVKHFARAENLILYGHSSQVQSPDSNRFFSEMSIKNDLRIQLPLVYFERFKKVFLLLEEQ